MTTQHTNCRKEPVGKEVLDYVWLGLTVPPPGPTCRADFHWSHTDEDSSRVARRREQQRRRAGVGRRGGQHTSHLGQEKRRKSKGLHVNNKNARQNYAVIPASSKSISRFNLTYNIWPVCGAITKHSSTKFKESIPHKSLWIKLSSIMDKWKFNLIKQKLCHITITT